MVGAAMWLQEMQLVARGNPAWATRAYIFFIAKYGKRYPDVDLVNDQVYAQVTDEITSNYSIEIWKSVLFPASGFWASRYDIHNFCCSGDFGKTNGPGVTIVRTRGTEKVKILNRVATLLQVMACTEQVQVIRTVNTFKYFSLSCLVETGQRLQSGRCKTCCWLPCLFATVHSEPRLCIPILIDFSRVTGRGMEGVFGMGTALLLKCLQLVENVRLAYLLYHWGFDSTEAESQNKCCECKEADY